MPAAADASGSVSPRLAEVVAAISLATDLGLGQPMEHGLRSCLIATRLGERLELGDDEQAAVFWVTLLAMVGCTGDSAEMAELFGDDIEFRAGMYDVGSSQTAMPRYLLSMAGAGGGRLGRVRAGATLMASGMRAVLQGFVADCENTARFAERLGFGADVSLPLEQKFARWDGKGIPPGTGGEDVPLPARVLSLSWRVEAHHRRGGVAAARRVLERHAGATLDPHLVSSAVPMLADILDGLEDDPWSAVVAAEPPRARLSGEAYDAALEALADFADLKSPWFTGHSRAVAELAAAAAGEIGLDAAAATVVRRAGLVHALGRTGVPNTIWDKSASLTMGERERVRLPPYLTGRILRRGSLAELADLASETHERLDGSGYPKGLTGAALSPASRLLAAADVYCALREARPHRAAFGAEIAARHLLEEARDGRLDAKAVEAVLATAGHAPRRRRSAPAGLTSREVEVLCLIALGRTSAEVAGELSITTKTVGTHIEHIYAKIGASNRSTATLFAMQHGLV